MRTTEKEINSTSWEITENGNASNFSFFCQVIVLKMSSYCNTVILSIIISFLIYCCWFKRGLKILVKIGDLQLPPPETQLLSLRKFKSVLYDWLYLQLWSKCIRGFGSTSLKWSAFGLLCATVPGCCTFFVENVLLSSSDCNFDCQVQVKAIELLWKLCLEMPQLKCQDPACLVVQRVRTWFEGCYCGGVNFAWGVPLNSQGAAGTIHTSIQPVWHDCFTWKGKNSS